MKVTVKMEENKKQDRRRKKQNIQSDIVDNEKKNLRNKETNIIAFFFVGLFLATIVYLCIFNVKDAGTIVNNPYNKRVDNQESKVVRGDILADDGDVLATTLTDEDGNETRYYPYDNLFCHSVGFTSLTGMKTGIEQSQNYFLLSETDNVLDLIGNDLSGGKAKGHNVTTTLNVELTKAAYKALGNNKGAVIAMEPATGKILAMVSNPIDCSAFTVVNLDCSTLILKPVISPLSATSRVLQNKVGLPSFSMSGAANCVKVSLIRIT